MRRLVVTASPAGITIDRGGWRRRITVIAAADIMDVDYSTIDGMLESARRSARVPSADSTAGGWPRLFTALRKCVPTKGVIVKSRQGWIIVGEGLPAEE